MNVIALSEKGDAGIWSFEMGWGGGWLPDGGGCGCVGLGIGYSVFRVVNFGMIVMLSPIWDYFTSG